MKKSWISLAFRTSAVYDGALALAFLFAGSSIFDYFGIERPNHMGYIQFPALLLIIFSAMYWRIASDPARFADLMPFGIGLKVAYSGVVFFHEVTGGIPSLWIPFAWIDLLFIVVFLFAWRRARTIHIPGQ